MYNSREKETVQTDVSGFLFNVDVLLNKTSCNATKTIIFVIF